ncbi:AAA domain-containing protein [Rhodococcus hoagii]|nr:AAA domain-containing protein [Prescottella equi]
MARRPRGTAPAGKHSTEKDHLHRLAALSIAYYANVPVILEGPPGQGKSTTCAAFAQALGCPLEVIVAAERDPTDIAGIPHVVDGVTRVMRPDWLDNIVSAGKGLILFDDITNAAPAVRSAILRGLDGSRTFARTQLPAEARIILACNPPDLAEDGYELGAPAANRILHLNDWELPAKVFTQGLRTGRWPAPPVYAFPNLDQHLTWARRAVASYLTARPSDVNRVPAGQNVGVAYPSPRTWDLLARLLGHARAARTPEGDPFPASARALLIEGTIGDAVAATFMEFIDNLNLPDPRRVLDDPTSWAIPARGDIVAAALDSIIFTLEESPTVEGWRNAGIVLGRAVDAKHGEPVAAILNRWITCGAANGWRHNWPPEIGPGSSFDKVLRLVEPSVGAALV